MRLFLVLTLFFVLGCLCMDVPEEAAEAVEAGEVDPARAEVEAAIAAEAARVEAAVAEAEGAAEAGGAARPVSIAGVCGRQADCGCAEHPSVEDCAAALEANAARVLTPDVLACILAQPCAEMCGGGAVRCVEAGAAAQSAAMKAQHDLTMEIIGNYPTGGSCARGQTEVRDHAGNFLRCQ